MQSHINSFADPVYQALILSLFLLRAHMFAISEGKRYDAYKQLTWIHLGVYCCTISAPNVCLCSHFACAHFLHACPGWCNAEACCVPTIPSFSFFAAPSKEAEPLCVCQPSSLGPIVKLNKPVCSGDERTYGEHKHKDGEEGGGREETGNWQENSFGRWTMVREGEMHSTGGKTEVERRKR